MTDARDYDPFPHALKAGRELDSLVAEKIFGLVRCQGPRCDIPYCYANPEMPEHGGECPFYSTDIAAAWELVEKLGTKFQLEYANGYWHAQFDVVHGADAEEAPLAIALAALKAVQP